MPLRVAMVTIGIAVGLVARAVAGESAGMSVADRGDWGPIYLLAVGWLTMSAAVALVRVRRRSAVLLYGVAMSWFVAQLAGPSDGWSLAFTAGLAFGSSTPALVAHLALSYPAGRLRERSTRWVVVGGYVVLVGLVGVGGAAVFDPVASGCLDCPANLLAFGVEPQTATIVGSLGVGLGAAWLLTAVAAVVWRLLSAGSETRAMVAPVVLSATVFLGSNAVLYLSSVSAGTLRSGGYALTVWISDGAALILLAASGLRDLWRIRRARGTLTRLVIDLHTWAPRGLAAALADRFGDPTLELGYPLDRGGRYVDARGRQLAVPASAERTVTPLVYRGTEIAVLIHRPGLFLEPASAEDLAGSIRLALDSERFAAEDLVRLNEIRRSGARIIAAGDAERRRIERDLHDAAQQRLVALLLNLHMIDSEAPLPALSAAQDELRGLIADLREFALGVFPVLLVDEGLWAALDALAETRRLLIHGVVDRHYPPEIESTVYMLVERLSGAGPTAVWVDERDRHLFVEIEVDDGVDAPQDLCDRARTLGGRLISRRESARITLDLPL